MNGEIYLDLRGMMPPEPMEKVLDALASMQAHQHIRILIDREPRPLYRILEKNGYAYEARVQNGTDYEIIIRQSV